MKRSTLVKQLKQFAKNETKEVIDFISRYEKAYNYKPVKKKKFKKKRLFTKASYQEYLNTPLWREIRQRVIDKKGTCCEGCGGDYIIQVHHTFYTKIIISGKSLRGLRVVCKTCHKKIHKLVDDGEMSLKKATKTILGNIKPKPKKKEHSLKIIKSSGLPATLHHSVMAINSICKDKSSEYFVEKYESRKNPDEFIHNLYFKYKNEVISFLNSLN